MKKKKARKKSLEKSGYDIETLTVWRKSSTKAKLNWLESVMRLAKTNKPKF